MDSAGGNEGRSTRRIRTVETLSNEQVQRKRNIDRRAQRVFRKKTKDYISNLEQEIASTREICNEKDKELSCLREQNALLLRLLNDSRSPWSNASYSPTREAFSQINEKSGLTETAANTQCSMSGVIFPAEQGTIPSIVSTSAVQAGSSYASGPIAAHLVTPLHSAPTCPLDHILSGFAASRRAMLLQGVTLDTVLGDHRPSLGALFEVSTFTPLHPLSALLSQVLTTFPGLKKPERFAFFYIMSLTMKWLILPTNEAFMALPIWLRPTATQVSVQHPIWMDNIPWPGVRDHLIEKSEELTHPVFSPHFSSNVSVNWPFAIADAVSIVEGHTVLHSKFEEHARNLENWTMSPEFIARFPEMPTSQFMYLRHPLKCAKYSSQIGDATK